MDSNTNQALRDRILTILKSFWSKYIPVLLYTLCVFGYVFTVRFAYRQVTTIYQESIDEKPKIDQESYQKYYVGDECIKKINHEIKENLLKIMEFERYLPENTTDIEQLDAKNEKLLNIKRQYNEICKKFFNYYPGERLELNVYLFLFAILIGIFSPLYALLMSMAYSVGDPIPYFHWWNTLAIVSTYISLYAISSYVFREYFKNDYYPHIDCPI